MLVYIVLTLIFPNLALAIPASGPPYISPKTTPNYSNVLANSSDPSGSSFTCDDYPNTKALSNTNGACRKTLYDICAVIASNSLQRDEWVWSDGFHFSIPAADPGNCLLGVFIPGNYDKKNLPSQGVCVQNIVDPMVSTCGSEGASRGMVNVIEPPGDAGTGPGTSVQEGWPSWIVQGLWTG